MSLLGKASRATYRAHRYERAMKDPGHYAKTRVISKGLGVLGFWRMFRRLYR